MSFGIILVLLLVLVGGYVLYVYNALSTAKVRIRASVQEIGNQLKRQADLIPNLETSAKGYLKHEKGIFKDLTEARKAVLAAQKSGNLEAAQRASQKISSLIPSIRIVVESNPQLQGADVVTNLMDELRDTSDKVMYSRRTLIDLSADYNTLRVTFPSQIVANLFSFGEEKGMSVPEDTDLASVSAVETKTPRVKI